MAANDFAIIIGINEYTELEKSNLTGAAADACDFKRWLIRDDGGNIPEKNITCIPYYGENGNSNCINSNCKCFGEKPEYSVVHKAFTELLIKSQNEGDFSKKIGRRLYIYMSGHGNCPKVDNPGLILPESKSYPEYIVSYPVKRAADHFFELKVFDEIFLIMDCCLDSFGNLEEPRFPNISEIQSDTTVKRSYAFATKWGEKTKETYNKLKDRKTGIFSDKIFNILYAKRSNSIYPFTTKQIEYCVRKGFSGGRKDRYNMIPVFLPNDELVIYNDKTVLVDLAIVIKFETDISELNVSLGDEVIMNEEVFRGGKRIFQCSVILGIYKFVLAGNKTVQTHHISIEKDTELYVKPDFSLVPV